MGTKTENTNFYIGVGAVVFLILSALASNCAMDYNRLKYDFKTKALEKSCVLIESN